MVSALLHGVADAAGRRLRQGPSRPSWSWPFEVVVGAYRGVMPYFLDNDDPPVGRRWMRRATALLPRHGYGRWREATVGGVPARIGEPDAGPGVRVLLYLHGGGYTGGYPELYRDFLGALANALVARVVAADYRLAPEHPYPAALDDALACYRAILAEGFPPEAVAVAGDSAGGGLVLALLQRLRDLGEPLPAAGVPLSPWADLTGAHGTVLSHAATDFLSPSMFERCAARYAGDTPRDDPGVSPLFGDFAGLPPLLIQVGGAETLLDDATRVAAAAREAGVDVTLQVWPDQVHVFQLLPEVTADAGRATRAIAEWLEPRLAVRQSGGVPSSS